MLAESGDPLIKLAELIEFEVFRGPLVGALARSDDRRAVARPMIRSSCGRQPIARARPRTPSAAPTSGSSRRPNGTCKDRMEAVRELHECWRAFREYCGIADYARTR